MATKRKVVSDVARSAHSNGRDATRPSEIAQLRYELERLRGELQFTQAQRDEYRQKMNLLLDRLVPPLPPWTDEEIEELLANPPTLQLHEFLDELKNEKPGRVAKSPRK